MRTIFLFSLAFFFLSCGAPKENQIIFNTNDDSIKTGIKKIISFEKVVIHGRENFIKGERHATLEVEIIDPPVPVTRSLVEEIGKKIVTYLQANLKNRDEFNHFMIGFTHNDHNWRNSSITLFYHWPKINGS